MPDFYVQLALLDALETPTWIASSTLAIQMEAVRVRTTRAQPIHCGRTRAASTRLGVRSGSRSGGHRDADFICPTPDTRAAFGDALPSESIASNLAVSKTLTGCSSRLGISICASRRKARRNIGPNKSWRLRPAFRKSPRRPLSACARTGKGEDSGGRRQFPTRHHAGAPPARKSPCPWNLHV
jgi:hypothetical protein